MLSMVLTLKNSSLIDVESELIAAIALQNMEGIGPVIGRRLMEEFGSFRSVFEVGRSELNRVPGVSNERLSRILNKDYFGYAEEELRRLEDLNVQSFVLSDQRYPRRLSQCFDAPLVVFSRGELDLNTQRMISVVGMRLVSDYGKEQCRKLVEGLAATGAVIVSGLAYGVDITAHRTALEVGLPTVAVFAHGLDRVYPGAHSKVAKQMLEKGGMWITDFVTGTKPDRENFPKRNRIIAGLSDATLVIESEVRGGSMITATLAFEYNREVFALPGDVNRSNCSGCHQLIQNQKASLITSADDLKDQLEWQLDSGVQKQLPLLLDWSEEERKIGELIGRSGITLDLLVQKSDMSSSELATLLLQMEMKGMLRSLPGMRYKLA
jgi:DNA processing protein